MTTQFRKDPTDLTPRLIPFEPAENWFEAYWYGDTDDRPGLFRRALNALGAGLSAAAHAAADQWRATRRPAGHARAA